MSFRRALMSAGGVVAVIGVGIGSAFLGISLVSAGAAGSEPAPGSIDVTVLAPVGYGDLPPELDDDTVSPLGDTWRIPVGADGALDLGRSMADLLAELLEEPAPETIAWDLPLVDDTSSDDPCAPADGADVDGCPDGVRGAIFAVTAPENLWGRGSSPHAPDPSLPGYAPQCAPVTPPANALPFGIATNAPGTLTMSYWPYSRGTVRPADAHTVTLVSDPDAAAAWHAGLASSESFEGDWTWLHHCTVIEGLTPRTHYAWQFTIDDELGRTFTSAPMTLALPDDRTRPPTIIRPIGDNIIFASHAHPDSVEVRMHIRAMEPGEAPDCSLPGSPFPLPYDIDGVGIVNVPADYLAANDYLPQYTKRTSEAFYVPEGTAILVCMAEFRHDRPSWQWFEAQNRTWAVVQTPNRPRPMLSIDSVHLAGAVEAESISISSSWMTGDGWCTLFRGPASAGNTVGARDLDRECGDRHEITQGNVAVSTSVTYDGVTTTSPLVLPLAHAARRVGPTGMPDTQWYRVPLTIDMGEVRMCGEGLRAPCDPLAAAGRVGYAQLKVEWSQGPDNGHRAWSVGHATSEAVEHERSELPRLEIIHNEVETVAHDTYATASYRIQTDRPVDYEVELHGECLLESTRTLVEGRAANSATVTFAVCLGEPYRISLTLTDDSGNVAHYGLGGETMIYDRFTAAPAETRVAVFYEVSRVDADTWWLAYLRELTLTIDGQRIDLALPENKCLERAEVARRAGIGLRDVTLSEDVVVELTVKLEESTGGSSGGAEGPRCSRIDQSGEALELRTTLALGDLDDGVVISAPDGSDYRVALTLQRYR